VLKLILALLLTVASVNASAEWQSIYSDDNFSIYADTSTIMRNGDVATMWTLLDFKADDTTPAANQSQSEKTRKEFDCRKRKFRQLQTALYSGHMGTGTTLNSNDRVADWMKYQNGSLNEIEWRTACGRN
jgi:Surface-adhesin protein E